MHSAISTPIQAAAPQRVYLIGTAVASVAAVGIAAGVAAALGGDSRSIGIAAVAVFVGSIASFIPAVLGLSKVNETFGMAVLAASIGRMFVALGIVVIAAVAMDLPRRPIGIGAGAGLLVALMSEVPLALLVLGRVSSSEQA